MTDDNKELDVLSRAQLKEIVRQEREKTRIMFDQRQEALDLLGLCRLALIAAPSPYATNVGVMQLLADIERFRFSHRPTVKKKDPRP